MLLFINNFTLQRYIIICFIVYPFLTFNAFWVYSTFCNDCFSLFSFFPIYFYFLLFSPYFNSFLWPMSNTATKLCFFWKNIVIKFGVSEKSRTFALAFRKYFRMSTKRKSSLKFLHTDKVVQELRVWSVFQVRHAGYMTQSNDRGEYDNKRTFWQTKQFACF